MSSALVRVFQSTIGLKLLMSASGLALVLFLVAHLAGNLLVFAGADTINNYARDLRSLGPLLWVARLGLLAAVVVHFSAGIRLIGLARSARPSDYGRKRYARTTLQSRSMAISGFLVLFFILYHLAHFTFRWTHAAEFQHLGEYDVYEMLVLSFRSAYVSSFYVVSILLLMLHLNHGISSLCQTLGLNHSHYNSYIKQGGFALSVVLALGFVSLPLSVWFGFVT